MPLDTLDDVDLGRQVARDLKANFLLGNLGLCPNLHRIPPVKTLCLHSGAPRRGQTHQAGFFFVLQAGLSLRIGDHLSSDHRADEFRLKCNHKP